MEVARLDYDLARWNGLRTKIQPGLYAESARWGDYRGTLKTVQGVWTTRTTTDAINFLSARNAVVISQLRAASLYPALNPPELSTYGGVVPAGTVITFSADPAATIYYTLGGSDPRVTGGGILPGASRNLPNHRPRNERTSLLAGPSGEAVSKSLYG